MPHYVTEPNKVSADEMARVVLWQANIRAVEALKEVTGSVDRVLSQLIGGIQSGMGYLGAANLMQLREKARFIRVTPAGQREAAPHDVLAPRGQ